MRFSYLAFFGDDAQPSRRIADADLALLRDLAAGLEGITRANFYLPVPARDLFNDDPGSPCFGFQFYFDELGALEDTLGATGGLQAIADLRALPSLEGMAANQQAMLNRPIMHAAPHDLARRICSYVVHYPGPAADLTEWLSYYLQHHPAIMQRFPGVREIEILTRIDWIDAMPWRRVQHMQRNRGAFDSAAALTAALHSDVRHEMRDDFAHFPSFENGSFHYPFDTESIDFTGRTGT